MLPWCRYGTGESFLFRFAPPDAAAQLLPAQAPRQSLKDEELSVHRWARSGCDRFQRSEKASIAMGGSAGGGGGFAGLWIDADMATGTTEGSDTFGSEPLLAAADAGTPEARGSAGTQQLPPPSSVLPTRLRGFFCSNTAGFPRPRLRTSVLTSAAAATTTAALPPVRSEAVCCGAESGGGSSVGFGIACVEVWGFECEERIAMNLRYMEYGVDPWEDTARKR